MKFLTPVPSLTAELAASILRAHAAMIAQRKLEGCCEDCGHPILDPAFGCDNERDCFQAQIDAKRREKAVQA